FLVQGTNVPNQTLHIGFRPNNNFTFAFWSNDLDVPASYTDTNWHHWACTYNAGTRFRAVYRDGVQVGTNVATADYTGSGILRIARFPTINSFYKGSLDEIRVWSGDRSAAQITANMNLSLTGNEPGLLANWKFGEGAGTTASDASPSGNTATLFNAPS